MNETTKAVFLSYASQDAAAVARLADALRAAGIEVWFDQSELVGGDAWDAKIRKQIGECALFVPVISAHTQARKEGYFRLEWKLAAQRTHMMSDDTTFLLPVVIDETRDADAKVPAEFRAVQWTRLRPTGYGGQAPADPALAKFCARVKSLLHAEGIAAGDVDPRPGPARAAAHPKRKADRRLGAMAWIAAAAVVGTAVFYYALPSAKNAGAATRPPTAEKSVAPLSEARQLVAKAWVKLNVPEIGRAELEVADDFCQRAAALDATDAHVWAAWSHVDSWYVCTNLDATPARRESARTKAARALQLAPESYEARLAQACYFLRCGPNDLVSLFPAEADALLRQLLQEQPEEPRALLARAKLARNTGKLDEARATYRRLAKQPAFATLALNELGWTEYLSADYRAAELAADASLASGPFAGNLWLKFYIDFYWHGDLALAQATLDRIPALDLQQDLSASISAGLHYWRRDAESMLRVLGGVSRDWLRSWDFDGPKAWWAGLAHQLAGRSEAAQLQWRAALRLVEQRLLEQPAAAELLRWKGRLLAVTGDRQGAETTLDLAESTGNQPSFWWWWSVTDQILIGKPEAALTLLEKAAAQRLLVMTLAHCRLNPGWDALRGEPRFQSLLARLTADPQMSPHAVPPPPAAAGQKSVAVLAFRNLSGDPAREFFSDGLSEAVTDVLGRVPGLKVVGSASAFYFKGKAVATPEIARQLGVTHLVEGTVLQEGQRVRITARLVQADGFQVGAPEKADRELKNIFALHDEVAGLIAKNLSLKLGASTAAAKAAVNPQAYLLYVQARQAWNRRTPEGFDLAESALTQALALEPNFARAHAALADIWSQRLYRSSGGADAAGVQSASVEFARIRGKITQALTLDPASAEAHASLGYLHILEGKTAEAESALRRAVALNPNLPSARSWLGRVLGDGGYLDEALAQWQLAIELDPLAPWITHGTALFYAGRYAEVLAEADRGLTLSPNRSASSRTKSLALAELGRFTEAVALVRALPDDDRRTVSSQIRVLARAGLKAEAEKLLPRLPPGAERSLEKPISLLALGRTEEALALMTATSIDADSYFRCLWDPIFDPVRHHPRWVALVAEAGLSDAHARAQAWRQAHPPQRSATK